MKALYQRWGPWSYERKHNSKVYTNLSTRTRTRTHTHFHRFGGTACRDGIDEATKANTTATDTPTYMRTHVRTQTCTNTRTHMTCIGNGGPAYRNGSNEATQANTTAGASCVMIVHVCVCVWERKSVFVCVFVCVCACACVCVYVCVFHFILGQLRVRARACVCAWMCRDVYVCMCVCVYFMTQRVCMGLSYI